MRNKQWEWLKKANILLFSVIIAFSTIMTLFPIGVNAESSVTLDSPVEGTTVNGGTVRVQGTYSNAYDITLFINGEKQVSVVTNDRDGDNTGTWFYDLETDSYHGEIILNAKGLDSSTRYGVWSSSVTIHVDNPNNSLPDVSIINPDDGQTVHGKVPIKIKVESKNSIETVQIRINHGEWLGAKHTGNHYQYKWEPDNKENQTYSLEARAIDSAGNIGLSLTTYTRIGEGTNEPIIVKKQDRAMWIWESESYKLFFNPNSRNVLDAFAKDTETFNSEPVTTLYLAVGQFAGMDIFEDTTEKLADFIKWAHEKGYEVHACISGGTNPPYMGAYEVFHENAIREIEKIINYNLAAGELEKFDGVNVDIEPYIAQDFKAEYPSLQIQYLNGLQKMIDRRNTAGVNLPFGPAIPKWYDSSEFAKEITWNGNTKWLSEHVQDISDYISIMDYRDSAYGSAGIIAGAEGEIDYARTIEKPNSVVIGVETLDIANSGDPETITFREEGRTHMEHELDKVYGEFGEDPYFGGIAVHHYDSIRTLPSFWGPGNMFWQPPVDQELPSAVNIDPIARSISYQEISLTFGMAYDDTEIDRYVIYRGTTEDFRPGPLNVAGFARGQSFKDIGLQSNTTYYYKVAARDMSGKIGPLSKVTSATTGMTELKPMVLTTMSVTHSSSKAIVQMKLIDKQTKEPIRNAHVEGRFTFAGGKYVGGSVDDNGIITLSSENIPNGHQVGFEPRRVIASGYYWAQAYDFPHTTTLYPNSGLSNLTLSEGELPFSKNTTSYSVVLPNTITQLYITPEAVNSNSILFINGETVSSGSPSQAIILNEGSNTLSILVANMDGSTDTYTINVTRDSPVQNVFNASEDTYVFENKPSENFGTNELLEIADIPRANGGGDRLTFLKFDFNGYYKPIDTAKLYFYLAEDLSNVMVLSIRGYDHGNWNENTMTWNNRIGGAGEDLNTVQVRSKGWYSIDVSDFVKKLGGNQPVTFRLMDPSTKSIVATINSRENSENQPYLILNE